LKSTQRKKLNRFREPISGSTAGIAPGWVEGVKKIAVLRANAIGDYIFALPALYALRAAYPQAEIVLLGKDWHVDYITGRPGPVKRVLPVPPYKGVSRPDTWQGSSADQEKQLEQFFTLAQQECFDLALQMHGGGGNSNPFLLRLGARLTAGSKAHGAPALDRWMPYIYWQHEIYRLLEVAGLVGAPPVMIEPRIEVTTRDREELREVVPTASQPYVVIHPGASDPRRRWSAERFAAVGDRLYQEGCQVYVVGIPAEQEVVEQVCQSMKAPAHNLCGAISLHGLTALLDEAALVIANDSGPRHLAEAVGTPTVGIYWCGNVINAGSSFRTFHRPHLSWRLDCPACGKNTLHESCEHTLSFVDEVQVDEVVESALDILRLSVEAS
jgi:ADP-heptose:LPS heptosyltransferase